MNCGLLIVTAGFSFGEPVNAVAAWAKGEELAIVANNDRKATYMPLVSDLSLQGQIPMLNFAAHEFPGSV